jgi:hypothetical protein
MANFMDWSDRDVLRQVLDGVAAGPAALTEAETDRLAAWFRDKWKTGPCPICATERWAPNAKFSHLPNENTSADGTVYPVLLVFCSNCGYTMAINARVAGIRTDETVKSDEAVKSDGPEPSA